MFSAKSLLFKKSSYIELLITPIFPIILDHPEGRGRAIIIFWDNQSWVFSKFF